jgi:hypothetical protein
MPPSQKWTEVAFDDLFTFRSPVPLTRTGGRGIDSHVGTWAGSGLTVLVDHGLFADPLTAYGDRADHTVLTESVDGWSARIVAAPQPAGGHMAAIHFPALDPQAGAARRKLTMVVEADTLDEEILLEMVRSITFARRDAAPSDSS